MDIHLTHEQRRRLHEAIVSTFDVAELRMFFRLRLGEPWDEVSGSGIRSQVALEAVDYFDHRGRVDDLLLALSDARPRNQIFRQLAATIIVTPLTALGAPELQRAIYAQVPFLDPEKWDADAVAAQSAVCLIDIVTRGKRFVGTGFLVGPALMLTARHVMKPVIEGFVRPEHVRVWFDRKYLRDGETLNLGVEYGLADEPFRAEDEDLDFALLRLNGEAGNDPIGRRHAEPGATTRGWLRFPNPPVDLQKEAPLLILQHPEGDPLKRAFDMRSIAGFSSDGRRVLHKTNTRPGSSGSPCFDADWRLAAMHVGVAADAERHNEAVIIEQIAGALRAHGVSEAGV